jgi:hypothetical protein
MSEVLGGSAFEELDEIDAENRTRTAMNEWF